ncbi:filamentous hemagglutinin N-terminal domain-containing protein [Moorena producens JHB]|uniref:Filamentous hemagglutinin N-terminal domain-containing protein n=1 Tax=Moorena producens (strain JHB) TaxID=1454205 RepID=A0A1D9FZ17_MOOP1|nr:filamentous hemagglutinin N-terminal domain-containing protein [Moorena producens]AOY80410.1 filamentous hemagglutinin N-terminal domain-containing protein [Moorena producens JHB]
MALDVLKRCNTQLGLALCLAISGAYASSANQAHAQITPDATLPQGERSLLDLGSGEVNGKIVDLIKGGAIRDINLFHSFLEFNVGDGQSVYFANPAGIQNILSRVTGANPSNILGTLGVNGGANLFLINPNGIFFGDKAKLDVSGSFVGTTADGIGFGNRGVFSASNPEPPSPLLTVNPNVFFFNQIPGNITSQAKLEKLAVDNLLLLGGDINVIEDSKISTNTGGNILLAGLGAPGQVALTRDGNKLGLDFPDGVKKGKVVVNNSAIETLVPEDGNVDGGEIRIIADSLEVETSKKDRGIFTITQGNGNKGGEIIITADSSVMVTTNNDGEKKPNQGIFTKTEANGGEGGKITITSGLISVSTSKETERRAKVEEDQGIFTKTAAVGSDGGEILLTADRLEVSVFGNKDNQENDVEDQGILTKTTSQAGNGGKITINAGSVLLTSDRSRANITDQTEEGIFTKTEKKAGIGGDIEINVTGDVRLTNKGSIKTRTTSSGQGGTIQINAPNGNVTMKDRSRIQAWTRGARSRRRGDQATGNGGETIIRAGRVAITEDSRIENRVARAEGKSGKIEIIAAELLMDSRRDLQSQLDSGDQRPRGNLNQITTFTNDSGEAGPIVIRVGSLTMIGPNRTGPSGITTSTVLRDGNAGRIDIIVEGDLIMKDRAKIEARTQRRSTGDGGEITIDAGSLSLSNNSFITAEARQGSKGNPGNIDIKVKDKIEITGFESGIKTQIDDQDSGNNQTLTEKTADITIKARSLSLKDGGRIEASTQGRIPAGDITVDVTDFVEISGIAVEEENIEESGISGIFTESQLGAQDVGQNPPKGGTIEVTTGKLTVSNGAAISARSIGEFQGGDITINAKEVEVTEGGEILSTATNSGLFEVVGVTEEGEIQTKPLDGDNNNGDPGNAGKITINASEQVIVSGSNPNFSPTVDRIKERREQRQEQLKDELESEKEDLEEANDNLLAERDKLENPNVKLTEAEIKTIQEEIEEIEQEIEEIEQDIKEETLEIQIKTSNDIIVIQDDIPQSRISVGATRGSNAGDLIIETKNLTVEDGGRISVSAVPLDQDGFPETGLSESDRGVAGKLIIDDAESLTLDNGKIVAATGKSTNNEDAANIDINVPGVIILDNNSLILADATGDGVKGGNITIEGGVLVALPLNNQDKGSDIFANAEDGDGGNIKITLQGLFNLNVLEDPSAFIGSDGNPDRSLVFGNNNSEIAALSFSGGQSGTVTRDITNSAQDPEILPTSLVDPSALIVANCPRSGKVAVDELGEFIVTGRGGLPPSPLDPINQQSVLVDWVTLDTEEENIEETTSTPTPDVSYLPMRGKRRTASTPTPARRKKKIVEAQGWTVGEDGTIILTAEPNNVTPKSNWYIPRSCGSKG